MRPLRTPRCEIAHPICRHPKLRRCPFESGERQPVCRGRVDFTNPIRTDRADHPCAEYHADAVKGDSFPVSLSNAAYPATNGQCQCRQLGRPELRRVPKSGIDRLELKSLWPPCAAIEPDVTHPWQADFTNGRIRVTGPGPAAALHGTSGLALFSSFNRLGVNCAGRDIGHNCPDGIL